MVKTHLRSLLAGCCTAGLLAVGALSAPTASASPVQPTIDSINTTPDTIVFNADAPQPFTFTVNLDEPFGWKLTRAVYRSCNLLPNVPTCTPQEIPLGEIKPWLTYDNDVLKLQKRAVNFVGAIPNQSFGQVVRLIIQEVELTYNDPNGVQKTVQSGPYYSYFTGDTKITIAGPDTIPTGSALTLTGTVTCFVRTGYTVPPEGSFGFAGFASAEFRLDGETTWTPIGPAVYDQNAGTYKYTNLAVGATGDWRIRFQSNACHDDVSPAKRVIAGTSPAPPPVDTSNAPVISLTSKTHDSATIDWAAPTNPGGNILAYRWGYTTDTGPQKVFEQVYPSPTDPFVFTGLAPETKYTIFVEALTDKGLGKRATLDVTTDKAPTAPVVTKPSAPTTFSVTARKKKSLTVNWNAPSDDGKSPITGYRVHRKGFTEDLPASARAYKFTGLKKKKTYQLYVRAENAAGFGPWANVTGKTRSR